MSTMVATCWLGFNNCPMFTVLLPIIPSCGAVITVYDKLSFAISKAFSVRLISASFIANLDCTSFTESSLVVWRLLLLDIAKFELPIELFVLHNHFLFGQIAGVLQLHL